MRKLVFQGLSVYLKVPQLGNGRIRFSARFSDSKSSGLFFLANDPSSGREDCAEITLKLYLGLKTLAGSERVQLRLF